MAFAAHAVVIKINFFFFYYLHTVALQLCTWKDNTALRCQFFWHHSVLMNRAVLELFLSCTAASCSFLNMSQLHNYEITTSLVRLC